MASWTQSTSGNVTTYTITDSEGNTGTIAVTANTVTGFTTALSASALHNDGLVAASSLLLLIETGKLPAAPASVPGSFS